MAMNSKDQGRNGEMETKGLGLMQEWFFKNTKINVQD